MPDTKGKATKTLKEEDFKSIAERVRTLLQEELEASMQLIASKLEAVQSELALLSTRMGSVEGELSAMKGDTKNVSATLSETQDRLLKLERKIAFLVQRAGL